MKHYAIVFLFLFHIPLYSCEKFLDEKPDASLSTPKTLNDLRNLMDYYSLNTLFSGEPEVMADNYSLLYSNWNALRWSYEKNYYIWKPTDQNNIDWNNAYKNIYTCNLVLENLSNIVYPGNQIPEASEIKGTALFFRASYFFNLLQLFSKTYNSGTSSTDPGIPLRLTTSFNETIQRNSVKDCYERIIKDLGMAASLLPDQASEKSRPSSAACFGSLSRTFLIMQDYEKALLYSDSCLAINSNLMDYNILNASSSVPIQRFNSEVIFQAVTRTAAPLSPKICRIDTLLFDAYNENDLRKTVYYKNSGNSNITFKGDYDGSVNNGNGHNFVGITTDEQYLIKAECLARLNQTEEANNTLNSLLEKRFKYGSFSPLQISNADELLDTILLERRKELVFRNLRLSDLKRLNLEPGRQTTLKRELNGVVYELAPDSDRYISLIPQMAMERSKIKQNP